MRLPSPWFCLLVSVLHGCQEPAPPPTAPLPRSVPQRTVPAVQHRAPAPGTRVSITAPEYRGTEVHHLLYLPEDWKPGGRYPVLVEYAGNGPYRNRLGDTCSGEVAGCKLGYGISGGRGFLWVCLPFVSVDGTRNERRWWGDVQRTVAYCKTVVPRICVRYGGDPERVVLVGFSRGAIACNYIGLHDAEIARLWCGFVCHSHYDGVRDWGYAGAGRDAARVRLARLGNRPQWISHERSVAATQAYLDEAAPRGRFVYRALPFKNHTDTWVLRESPDRAALRAFVMAAVR